MMTDMIQRIVMMVVFCLVQVMVLNRIHVFNCATPLLYVYFAIMFPRNYPRWAIPSASSSTPFPTPLA